MTAASRVLVVLALCPLIATVGPKLLTGTIVVGVAALVLATLLARHRGPSAPVAQPWPGLSLASAVFLGLLVWCGLSFVWSYLPDRSLEQLPIIAAIVATALLGLEAARALPARVDRCLFLRVFTGVYMTLLGVYAIELLGDMPLMRWVVQALSLPDTPHPANLNRGMTLLALTAGPLLAALWSGGRVSRTLALLLIPATGAILMLGESQTALLAGAAGLGAAAAAWFLPPRRLRHALTALVVVMTLLLPLALTFGLAQMRPAPGTIPITALARLEILALYAEPLASRPLLGWGLNTATRIPRTPMSPDALDIVDPAHMTVHPHNNLVELWLDLGIAGPLLALALGLIAARRIAALHTPQARAGGTAALTAVFVVALAAYGLWQEDWLAQVLFTTLLIVLLFRPMAGPLDSKSGADSPTADARPRAG